MSNNVVLGAGFGDEGKGLVTDWLCRSCAKPLVIRFSGGQQAGHTVVANGLRHVFANFGSGTLQGAPSYFSRFCTVDPVGIINELNLLLKQGIQPLLFIDAQCPVTTPYDIARNQEHHPHGSCGVGVGDTLNREEQHFSLTFGDLFLPWVLATRLDLLRRFFYKEYTDVCVETFLDCCAAVTNLPYIRRTYGFPEGTWSDLIYEGSQGLLLDQHFGFFPYVTRSNTGTANVLALNTNQEELEVWLVSRAYQTRHGDGPMSNEHLPHNIQVNPKETNIHNRFQGAFRHTLLDLDLLEYALQRDAFLRSTQNRHLVLTCLDQVQTELRFTRHGQIVYCDNSRDFTSKIGEILGCNRIYTSSSDDGNCLSRVQ